MPAGSGQNDVQLNYVQNEQLFTKIRDELSTQLSESLKKINTEISDIRSKQTLMSTIESR